MDQERLYTESREDTCNINIDEDMDVKYESSDENYNNKHVESNYTAQNLRI